LVNGYELVDSLKESPMGDSLPDSERQVRELLRLKDHVRAAEVWQQVLKDADGLVYGNRAYEQTDYDKAMSETGLERKTLQQAKYVAGKVESSMRIEDLTWNHHLLVAPFEAPDQKRLLKMAVKGKWSVADLRAHIQAKRRGDAFDAAANLPPGQYAVALADPPWAYDFAETDCRHLDRQYSTLGVEAIGSLVDSSGRVVQSLFAEDAVLFCWTTSPKLKEGIATVEAWGFAYKTCMVWVKDRIGMGYYARQRHRSRAGASRLRSPAPPARTTAGRPPILPDRHRRPDVSVAVQKSRLRRCTPQQQCATMQMWVIGTRSPTKIIRLETEGCREPKSSD
jgi:hypothetical protein